MPIQLDDAQNHHPLMLTRQEDADKKPLQGEFTLDALRSRFALENGTESEVLAEAAAQGHAFFKSGDVYVGFAPLLGETENLPARPIAKYEIFDDAEDLEDEEIEVDELEIAIRHPIDAEDPEDGIEF